MLNRNSRPQKKTIFKLAEALQVEPVALWPDLEVAEILDRIADFPRHGLTDGTEQPQFAVMLGALGRQQVAVA